MDKKLIPLDSPPVMDGEDYVQSANSLFHFMKEQTFLHTALSRKALIPRYCRENISYLSIVLNDVAFNEIAVPQKCFCDIPLHSITTRFQRNDETATSWSGDHTQLYGGFALAFSKQWGERNHLQPIQYINTESFYCRSLVEYIMDTLQYDEMSEERIDDVLFRLSLIKPLRGIMQRYINNEQVSKTKNFYDEQEWRYIPNPEIIRRHNQEKIYKIAPIIANPEELKLKVGYQDFVGQQSLVLEEEIYHDLWLKFSYDDLKYIIVPDIQSRVECISYILNLPDGHFDNINNIQIQKSVLISKILVLEEIRKDW